MKKSDVVSLPVISVDQGKYLGKVKDVILDPNSKSIVGLIITRGKFFAEKPHLVNLENVQTIGAYAITVPSESVVMTDEQQMQDEYQGFAPPGKRVISDRGESMGICRDYTFEFPSGQVVDLLLETKEKRNQLVNLPVEDVITLGTDYIIVSSGYTQPQPAYSQPEHEPVLQGTVANPDNLIGKIATQTVQDGNGEIIVAQGEQITREVVDTAIKHNALQSLAMVTDQPQTFEPSQPPQPPHPGPGQRPMYETYQDTRPEPEWQTKLRQLLDNAGEDIEGKLRNFLIGKVPAYTVVSQSGNVLKEKGERIDYQDVELIRDRSDLMRLATSITAKEIDGFVSSLESKFQDLVYRR